MAEGILLTFFLMTQNEQSSWATGVFEKADRCKKNPNTLELYNEKESSLLILTQLWFWGTFNVEMKPTKQVREIHSCAKALWIHRIMLRLEEFRPKHFCSLYSTCAPEWSYYLIFKVPGRGHQMGRAGLKKPRTGLSAGSRVNQLPGKTVRRSIFWNCISWKKWQKVWPCWKKNTLSPKGQQGKMFSETGKM